jgi:hypothetical protein
VVSTNKRLLLAKLVESPSVSDLLSDLDMTVELRDEGGNSGERFQFRGVHGLSITKSARLFYFGSLSILDIRLRQLEDLTF